MKKQFIVSGYNITTDPSFQNEKFGNVPELLKQMETLYLETQDKNNKKIIDKLNNLIVQYSLSPQLKNYLSVAFSVQGKYDKAKEVNNWIITEHPEYLFAKLNRANEFITNDELEKVPEILGDAMELKSLYPNRDLFHLAEVTGFLKVTIHYFAAKGNLELAENRLKILKEIAPNHPDTEAAEKLVFTLLMLKGKERWDEERKLRIAPKNIAKAPKKIITKAPEFNHSEIENLYHFDLAIPPEMLSEILALPRTTLIADLEKMLIDAVERYAYFVDLGWEEETHNFVLHALFLLKEMNAEESLPQIISFLVYDDEFLNFWLGDHLTESLWLCFYSLGLNNTGLLKQLLLLPNLTTYVKAAVTDALSQMVLHNPEKRNEILTIFSDVFTTNLAANIDDDIIDSDFLGIAVGDAIDCNLNELLPVIKQLYEKGYVGLEINGLFKDVEKEFANLWRRNKKKELFTIFEIYDNVLKNWSGYQENDDDFVNDDEDYNYTYKRKEQAVSNKINRNDPCPCGSGKKYKKCCIDKF